MDSLPEGTGFEPPVARGKSPTLRVSVLFRSDSSVGGEPTRGIERLVVSRGTDGSNPVPSSAESATNQSPGVWASALDQWVELTNNTRMTIVEIHPFAVPGCREVRTKALCQADVVRFRQHRRRDGGPLVTP